MSFFLSRQRDAKDNCLYIEISVSGKKGAGVDVLTPRYPGELKNLVDPRDAINLAEKMAELWEKDYFDERKKLRIVGTSPIQTFDLDSKGITKAKLWADKTFAGMKKCGHCNKAMGNRDPYELDDLVNMMFCSELCLSTKYRNMYGVEAPNVASNKNKKVIKK